MLKVINYILERKYRVRTSMYGYDPQYKIWYWPFWTNFPEPSHDTRSSAMASIHKHISEAKEKSNFKSKTVWDSSKNAN